MLLLVLGTVTQMTLCFFQGHCLLAIQLSFYSSIPDFRSIFHPILSCFCRDLILNSKFDGALSIGVIEAVH